MFKTTLLVLSCALGLGTQCSAKEKPAIGQQVTIFDGHDVWELTPDGLKKMPKQEEKGLKKKGDVETGPRHKCRYCPRKFWTHAAWYWHNRNKHNDQFYRENMRQGQ